MKHVEIIALHTTRYETVNKEKYNRLQKLLGKQVKKQVYVTAQIINDQPYQVYTIILDSEQDYNDRKKETQATFEYPPDKNNGSSNHVTNGTGHDICYATSEHHCMYRTQRLIPTEE